MIKRKPIVDVKSTCFGKKFYRVKMEKYFTSASDEVKIGELKKIEYPVVEILSVEVIRPNDSRDGIIVEGILVNVNDEILPGTLPVKDVTLMFDQSDVRIEKGTWVDSEEIANEIAHDLAIACKAEADRMLNEVTNYRNFVEGILERQ